MSRSLASPIVSSENKTQSQKFARIEEVAIILLDNPKMSLEDIRKKIAMNFFISMRIALDYLHYAQLVIDEWKENRNV